MSFTIELDREREFKYGMRAIDYIEKHRFFKKPITQIDMDNLTMDQTSVFLLAGLRHDDKNLTTDNVLDLVDEYSSYTEVMFLMGKALTLAMAGEEALEQMEKEMSDPVKND